VITFSQLGKYGRLGNQLFQYAALRSLSLQKGYECKIPNPAQMEWHGQKCLLDKFNIEAEYLKDGEYDNICFMYREPNINKFDKNFFHLGDGVDLLGFFQSTKYFNKFKKQIIKELTPRAETVNRAREYIESKRSNNCELVSVHLRMGDLIDGTNPIYNDFYGDSINSEDSAYGKYFNQAIKMFDDKNVKFLVFCGGSRDNSKEDVSFMESLDDRFVLCSSEDPLMDFTSITLCEHNICCHLTTFGWWAAFLNPNPNKIVTMPQNYFYDERITRESFFPDEWRLF
jgi:hypothetical protein